MMPDLDIVHANHAPAGKYGNKAIGGAQALKEVGGSGTVPPLAAQPSMKYKANAAASNSGPVGAVGKAGGGKYMSPYSLRQLAVKEQAP